MWGMSWANLLMYMASIPDYSLDKDKDEENTIDTNNWKQYL